MTKHELKLKKQREYRKRNGNACTNKYEKTINGFLVRKYRNMLSRVSGVQRHKSHLYKDLKILSKENFYRWTKEKSLSFLPLFINWEKSGYDRKLCPTVDRIDSNKGYILDNMRWITHSENSRLGALSEKRKIKLKI